MPPRNLKHRRLDKLIGVKGVSTAALAHIMRELHDEPIEPASEWTINQCPWGPTLVSMQPVSLPMGVHPCLNALAYGPTGWGHMLTAIKKSPFAIPTLGAQECAP